MPHANHLETAARKKLKAPDEWRAYRFEVVNEYYLIEGSVPVGFYKRGPRKGQPKWKGEGQRTIVTKEEVKDAEISYENTTGIAVNALALEQS